MSSSRRREQLYEERGFNKQQWQDLVDDYATSWSMHEELDEKGAAKEIRKHDIKTQDPKAKQREDESGHSEHKKP